MADRRRQVLVAPAFVQDGRLFLAKRAAFDAAVANWRSCPAVVRLEESRDPRSAALNAYYWGVVIEHIVEETGYTDREAHEEMKKLHLPIRFAAQRQNGRVQGVRVFDGSTTDLSNDEEWEFIENIQRWAATTLNGLVIPDPRHV